MDELRERAERWLEEKRGVGNSLPLNATGAARLMAAFTSEVVKERDADAKEYEEHIRTILDGHSESDREFPIDIRVAGLVKRYAALAAVLDERDAEIARLKREVEEEKAKQRTDERQCDEMTATAAALAQENARLKRQVEAGEKLREAAGRYYDQYDIDHGDRCGFSDDGFFCVCGLKPATKALASALAAWDSASKPEVG